VDYLDRKAAFLLAAFCSATVLLAGCAGEEHYVVRADDAQIGKGATIEMTGKQGQLHVPQIPGWPHGIDVAVTETDNVNGITSRGWAVSSETHVELKFIVAAGHYICTTCQAIGLPLDWHRETLEP
jgi:hypothetical protein